MGIVRAREDREKLAPSGRQEKAKAVESPRISSLWVPTLMKGLHSFNLVLPAHEEKGMFSF